MFTPSRRPSQRGIMARLALAAQASAPPRRSRRRSRLAGISPKMDRLTAAEALRQVLKGKDFQTPAAVLSRITSQAATRVPNGAPYSIATNIAHADFWQRLWLCRLKGLRRPRIQDDWRVPEAGEWAHTRSSFLEGMQEALDIAESRPFKHEMKSDEAAIKTLLEIAIHNAYHIGQVALLKRLLKMQTEAR